MNKDVIHRLAEALLGVAPGALVVLVVSEAPTGVDVCVSGSEGMSREEFLVVLEKYVSASRAEAAAKS